MIDAIAPVLDSLDRLLAHATDREGAVDALQAAGLLDALVAEERPFATAGALVRRVTSHGLAAPIGDLVLARWLLHLAGVEGDLRPALAWPGTPPSAILAGSFPEPRAEGLLRAVRAAGGPILAILPHDDAPRLVLIDALASPERQWRNLAGEARSDIRLDGTPLRIAAPLPDTLPAETPFLAAAFLQAAEMLGAMDRCFELTRRYATERKQFGRPIASFQAVQGMVAEMAVTIGTIRVAFTRAGAALDRGQGAIEVASLKILASSAAGEVAARAHQVHGAIGFTQEYPLGEATRRLWAWRDEQGREAYWSGMLGSAARNWGPTLWGRLVDGDGGADAALRRLIAVTDFSP